MMTNPPVTLGAPPRAPSGEAGRRPRQERSRQRVETILDVALDMVVEHGAEALAMREVARRAGVQISSIYQYFPSKAHIIRELAKRNLQKVRLLLQAQVQQLEAEFAGAPPVAEAVNRLVDAYFAHYRDRPDALAVWAGAQSDHGLRELDLEDTRSTAEFLVLPLQRILRRDDRELLYPLALLVCEVTGAAARLALALEPPLRDQLISRHKAMLVATLEDHRCP